MIVFLGNIHSKLYQFLGRSNIPGTAFQADPSKKFIDQCLKIKRDPYYESLDKWDKLLTAVYADLQLKPMAMKNKIKSEILTKLILQQIDFRYGHAYALGNLIQIVPMKNATLVLPAPQLILDAFEKFGVIINRPLSRLLWNLEVTYILKETLLSGAKRIISETLGFFRKSRTSPDSVSGFETLLLGLVPRDFSDDPEKLNAVEFVRTFPIRAFEKPNRVVIFQESSTCDGIFDKGRIQTSRNPFGKLSAQKNLSNLFDFSMQQLTLMFSGIKSAVFFVGGTFFFVLSILNCQELIEWLTSWA